MSKDDNIIDFETAFFGDIPTDDVLEGAKGKLKRVLVIGLFEDQDDKAGHYYFASSSGDKAISHWDASNYIQFLLERD